MKIFHYVDASDFSEWVCKTFNIDKSRDVRHELLENDYIEGSLGGRWTLGYVDEEQPEKTEWFNDFLLEFNLEDIRLKY